MVQLTLAPVDNVGLFTNHYLEERLKNSKEWQEEGEIREAYEEIKGIYEERKDRIKTYTNNEAQLERDFIRPVLESLNHAFGVQATIQENAKRPDYGFFETEEDLNKAFKEEGSTDFYENSIAIGDAKAWDKDLDKKLGKKDVFENHNPSYQIDYYLRTTKPDWGILTNGRKWRLYYEKCPQPIGTYYEVDLIDILEKDDFENFKYFYLFFRREAFTPVGDSFLDKVYNRSLRYAEQIGESLEENMYKALLWMAKGFFKVKQNGLEVNEENIKEVHDNSLIFLYRLLFLLYAESKGLLASEDEIPRKYSEYSANRWVDELLEKKDKNSLNEKGGIYYYQLNSIFRLVREGSEGYDIPKDEFYVPAYNGGLFDDEKHPFLRDNTFRDGYLAKIVDLLARTESEEGDGKLRVDYSDLSLRHLGGIYEGLLEYKLKIADKDMVSVKKKGTLKWIPLSESKKYFSEFDEDKRVRKGEIYLETDKGERKATGSYYTPEYIVDYIVENTVGPLLEDKLEGAETNEEKRKAILSTKVLDPAMGSGHFLVDAMDFMANELVKYVDEGGEKRDIDWAKREVARNCIYGVDVNPLATELAKVSLWLNTMAEDKPLSFIDHHLKTGNSLIGADIHKLDRHPEDVGEETEEGERTGQLALSDFFGKSVREDIKQLLSRYKEMLEITEERPEDIKKQEQLFQKFEEHPFKKKFDVLADVKTSYYFGNEFSKTRYEKLLEAFRSGDEDWEEVTQEDWVKKASDSVPEKREDNLSDQKRFFHWKLEFPEIFFDIKEGIEKENSGFDAVVGNPPYLLMEEIPKSTRDFAYGTKKSSNYISASRKTNIYALFIEKAYNLLSAGGKFGYINPYSWMGNSSFKPLRTLILENMALEEITLLPNDVFQDPDTESSIFLANKKTPKEAFRGRDLSVRDVSNNPNLLKKVDFNEFYQKDFLNFPEEIITFRLDKEDQRIIAKIREDTVKLEELCKVDLGVKTAADEKFTGKIQKKDGNTKRLLRGKDFSRYSYLWNGDYIYYNPEKMKENKSTARPGSIERFESPKLIMHRFNSENFKVAIDRKGHYTLSSTYVIRKKDEDSDLETIAGLLNSKLLQYYLNKFITGNRLSKTPVRELPISTKPNENLKKHIAKLKHKKQLRGEKIKEFIEWLDSQYEIETSLKNDISNRLPMKSFPEFLELLNKNEQNISQSYNDFSEHEKLKKGWTKIKGKIDELDTEIKEINNKADSLLFDLYGLNENEIKVILDSLETEEEIKEDILEKFRKLD